MRVVAPAFTLILVLSVVVAQASRGNAQTQAQPDPATVAALRGQPTEGAAHDDKAHDGGKGNPPATGATVAPDPEISPAVAKELATMHAEIEALKAELKNRNATEPTLSSPPEGVAAPASAAKAAEAVPAGATTECGPSPGAVCRYGCEFRKAGADGSLCLRRLDLAER